MLRSWVSSNDCKSWALYQKVKNAGISSVDQLLDVIDARLPRKLFPSDLSENSVCQVCKAYWDRVRKKFGFEPECEGWFTPIRVMTVDEFKTETLQLIKAGLWKLKLSSLNTDDESVIRARLITLKEATRLASKFREVYIHWDYFGREVRDMHLASVIPFNTKGEMFEWLLLGEDQVWYVRRSGNSYRWYIYFGDGNVPEMLDYRVDVKIDADGNFYIFTLDDLGELLGSSDLEKIRALVGK
jgi:hypothetical protein